MANLPTSVPSFTTKNSGDDILPAHMNAVQDEITAAGDMLLNGWAQTKWQAYTPVFTNLSVGNGTLAGKYFKFGDLAVFRIDLVFGTTTSISGSVSVTFPVTAETGQSFTVSHGEAIDTGTGSYGLHGRLASATTFAVFADNGTSLLSVAAAVPFVWTTGDELHLLGICEAV